MFLPHSALALSLVFAVQPLVAQTVEERITLLEPQVEGLPVPPRALRQSCPPAEERQLLHLALAPSGFWPLRDMPQSATAIGDKRLLMVGRDTLERLQLTIVGLESARRFLASIESARLVGLHQQNVLFVRGNSLLRVSATNSTFTRPITVRMLDGPDSVHYALENAGALWLATGSRGGFQVTAVWLNAARTPVTWTVAGPTRLVPLAPSIVAAYETRSPFRVHVLGLPGSEGTPRLHEVVTINGLPNSGLPGQPLAAASFVPLDCQFALLTLADLRSPIRWLALIDLAGARVVRVRTVTEPLGIFGADSLDHVLYGMTDAPAARGVRTWIWSWEMAKTR